MFTSIPGHFLDIAIVLLAAAAGGLIARFLRVPLISGYIIAGLGLGFAAFHQGSTESFLHNTQTTALTFLLFTAGLELNWKSIGRQLRSGLLVAILTGVISLLLGTGIAVLYDLSLSA